MFEIDESMTPLLFLLLKKFRPSNYIFLLVVFPAKTQITKISGCYSWNRQIAGLSDAQRCPSIFEDAENFVVEPGDMTKLESNTCFIGKSAQKVV